MKKLLVLVPVLLLSACVSVPVARHFPDQPETTKESCADLLLVPEGTDKLSEVLRTVLANYGQYQECKIKADTWQEWYNKQKEIFDSVK